MDDFLKDAANNLSDPELWVIMILLIALFPIYSRLIEWVLSNKYNKETGKESVERVINEESKD